MVIYLNSINQTEKNVCAYMYIFLQQVYLFISSLSSIKIQFVFFRYLIFRRNNVIYQVNQVILTLLAIISLRNAIVNVSVNPVRYTRQHYFNRCTVSCTYNQEVIATPLHFVFVPVTSDIQFLPNSISLHSIRHTSECNCDTIQPELILIRITLAIAGTRIQYTRIDN